MDNNRRNLMKGMLTGGTLLALGVPPGALASAPADKTKRCGLLLENSNTHAEFAAGARTALGNRLSTAGFGRSGSELPMVKLSGGLLDDYEVVAGLLENSSDMRWVAVLDDGSAAVFTELARTAGARLLLLGSHVSSGGSTRHDIGNGAPELRHVWTAASTELSAGSILASQLVTGRRSFSIKENFLSSPHSAVRAEQVYTPFTPVPGFEIWRSGGPDATYLYCSGLSPSAGCELLGWVGKRRGSWASVSHKDVALEAAAGIERSNGNPEFSNWAESVGYAVMATALGTRADTGVFHEPCSSRAFVHWPGDGLHAGLTGPAQKFASFIIET